MFKHTQRLLQPNSGSLKSSLGEIWRRDGRHPPRRVGLAVSGGVDSMALAYLCSEMRNLPRDEAMDFTAFVVDHKLRDGSTAEANNVRDNLAKMGISCKVLTLDWSNTDRAKMESGSGSETIARKLRYQALGAACAEAGISSLLFAHHGVDQGETVLLRVINQRLGTGLAGIRQEAQLPECGQLYGVQQSGRPRKLLRARDLTHGWESPFSPMLVESGGVRVVRPLLSNSKEELVEVCKKAGVEWFEDETNSDLTFTLRNTVRHLQESNRLPKALQTPRLIEMAQKVRQRELVVDFKTKQLFEHLQINLGAGRASCKIPLSLLKSIATGTDSKYIQTTLLRKLLETVSPNQEIALQDLCEAADLAFATDEQTLAKSRPFTIANVLISMAPNSTSRRMDKRTLIFQRAPPTSKSRKAGTLTITVPQCGSATTETPRWSDWHLWDNRYWIQVANNRAKKAVPKVVVKFFQHAELSVTRNIVQGPLRTSLASHLENAKGVLRFCLPAIYEIGGPGGSRDRSQLCVALPSLGWSLPEWQEAGKGDDSSAPYLYRIRYKNLDDSLTEEVEDPSKADDRDEL